MDFLEICRFIKDGIIEGEYDYVEAFDSKEQCVKEVKAKYQNATGVWWDEDNNNCYAKYGNKLIQYSGAGYWACLLEGNAMLITLLHLTIYFFTSVDSI